jgi:hypothetical protein
MRGQSLSIRTCIATTALLCAASASAVPVLDQSFEELGSATGGSQGIAQTFTVTVTGTLTGLDIFTQQLTGVSLGILATTGGAPTPFSTALGVMPLPNVPFSTFGDWLSVDLTPLNLSVTAGDVLAWALLGGQAQIKGNDFLVPGDRYTGGAAFSGRRVLLSPPGQFPPVFSPFGEAWVPASSQFTIDHAFRTYVEPVAVPEPPTFALLALALVAAFFPRRSGGRAHSA